MLHGWTSFVLAWVVMATATLCQSGEWGSGFDILSVAAINGTEREVGDEPERSREDQFTSAAFSPSPSPALQSDSPSLDKCSVHFSTSARRLRAQREELAYLQAVQHGNKAVVDNLVQFVGAEVGDQSYEDVIRENIIAIQEEQKNCHRVVEKAEEDLQQQLEGEVSGIRTGMQKIREESRVFEDMFRATVDIANRLEVSSQALHAAFTKQLKDVSENQHKRKLCRA